MKTRICFVKKFSFSKKQVAALLCCFVLAANIFAEGAILFSAYPHFTLPLGSEKHNINYGIGGGAKLSYKPWKFFEFGLYGDYFSYQVESIDPISVFDVGLSAGYVLPMGDRFGMNFGLNVGMYKAVKNISMTGLEAGLGISFAYRARPAVSFGVGTSFAHFAAGETALINGLSFYPQITFNLTEAFSNKTKINMEPEEILPVFPVLYSWYEDNSFAIVKITNEENVAIENVKVSFWQPQYMGHPNVCFDSDDLNLKIDAGKSISVELTAFFNERMLEMTEKTDTQAFVTVEYTCLGKKKSKEFPMVIPVYGRNSMSWSDDRRAAVFVSSKDPAAMLYSKHVSSIVRENMRIGVPVNIQYAMGIFDSLAGFGINYVIDPSSAYTDNVGTETPDFLQFPYQTLSYRGGDCDDLSILMCSLLEAIGIETAFITIPGHIYMAFNSGLNVAQASEQFGALDNFIVLENEVWVPLEITLTDEGFNRAWRVGAREWRVAERDGTAAIYRMKDSWQIYKPVSVPGAAVTFSMPEKTEVAAAFEKGVDDWILREIGPKVEAYKSYIARTGDIGAQNDLGALYGRYGISELANEQLKTPAKKGMVAAMLNTANVHYTRKEYAKAKKLYKQVLKREPNNALAYLGIARCCYELEEYNECDLAYQKAQELDKPLSDTYAYLGAFESTVGRAFNLADRLAYTVWPTEGNTGYKDVIDAVTERKNEELLSLYGDAAKETIEKEQAAASFAKEREIGEIVFEERDDHPYVGLPNEISILTSDGMLALKEASELDEVPEVAAAPVEEPKIEIPVVAEIPKEVPPEEPKVEELPKPEELPPERRNLLARGPLDVPMPPAYPRPKVVETPKRKPNVEVAMSEPVEEPKTVEQPKPVTKTKPVQQPKTERVYDEFPGDEEPPVVAKAPEPKPVQQPKTERIYDEFPGDKEPAVVPPPAPKPKAQPKPKPAPKPAPKVEPKPKVVEQPKPAPKPVEKPKAEPKPAPKVEPKPKPVEYPHLVTGGYYVQIGTFTEEEKLSRVYKEYGKRYPIVVEEKGNKKIMFVGPLGIDEYGAVLERFRAYGFTDAFVKCIM